MSERFAAIQSLTPADIVPIVRDALREGLDAEAIGVFLAGIEWGSYDVALPVVREMLGALEMWSTQYAERDLSESEYAALLQDLVRRQSESERLATA